MSTFAGQQEGRAWLANEGGSRIELSSSSTIGRSSACHLRVAGVQASREHALVNFDPTGRCWWLSDLDSTNGTYLNGRKIRAATKLQLGDRIGIGNRTWTFHCEDFRPQAVREKTATDMTVAEMSLRKCWLLFVDVVGSSPLARELGPEEMGRCLKMWATECEEIVKAHDGWVNEFMGDGFLAIWYDQTHTSEKVLRSLREFNAFRSRSTLRFRVVLHLGEVLIGGGGPTSGMERTTGADVSFVFKAEKVAGNTNNNEFFISGAAAEKLSSSATLQHLGNFLVPGFDEPCAFYTLQ